MFLPLRDLDNPVYRIRVPVVTWTIIAINVAVFLLLNAMSEAESVTLLIGLSFRPSGVAPEVLARLPHAILDLPDLVSAVTAMFVQRDLWHLAGNMLCLWVFADNVEDAMGHAKFLLFYLAVGLCATFVQGALMAEPQTILYGASGAVSGVIAAYVMLHPNVRLWVIVLLRIPLKISAMWVIGAWVLYQVVNLAIADANSGVGWWAHVAGLVAGAILTPLLKHPDVQLFDRGPRAAPAEAGKPPSR